MRANSTFFSRLLAEDERLSRMDLEYWIDYVERFGVKEKIPLYDNMGFIEYRNWDVYAFLFTILFIALLVWIKVLKACCSLCKKSK
jgi:hypothetical protein